MPPISSPENTAPARNAYRNTFVYDNRGNRTLKDLDG